MSLKEIASDLAEFADEATPPPDSITEAELNQLGRTVIHYVMSQIDSDDPPEMAGEAVVIGARALAEDTGADPDAVIEQAILTIERMAEAARSLHGGLVESKGEIKGLIRKAMSHATRAEHKADAAGLDRAYDALSEATSALARAEHSL